MKNPFRRKPKHRRYGRGGTIHQTGHFDIETHQGTVVAVWFRCQMVRFQQSEVGGQRASDMESMYYRHVGHQMIPRTEIPAVVSIELVEEP